MGQERVDHAKLRQAELENLTDEALLNSISSNQKAIDRSEDGDDGNDYDLASCFESRDRKLLELARRKNLSESSAWAYYQNWVKPSN